MMKYTFYEIHKDQETLEISCSRREAATEIILHPLGWYRLHLKQEKVRLPLFSTEYSFKTSPFPHIVLNLVFLPAFD